MQHITQTNLETRLTTYLDNLIVDRSDSDPGSLCKTIKRNNAYYARILLDVYLDIEPKYEQIATLGFGNVADAYQNALFLFYKWRDDGLGAAITSYCSIMKRLVAISSSKSGGKGAMALNNFHESGMEIADFIRSLMQEGHTKINLAKN